MFRSSFKESEHIEKWDKIDKICISYRCRQCDDIMNYFQCYYKTPAQVYDREALATRDAGTMRVRSERAVYTLQ